MPALLYGDSCGAVSKYNYDKGGSCIVTNIKIVICFFIVLTGCSSDQGTVTMLAPTVDVVITTDDVALSSLDCVQQQRQ